MHFYELTENKKQYLPLLLLADEQENMVDRYLHRGRVFVLAQNGVKAQCVVTHEGDGVLEIKNIAVAPEYQRQGYGKALIEYIAGTFAQSYSVLQVGTGDVPSSVAFYEGCGFVRSGVVENFFTDNYDHIMVEDGIQLVHMVYFSRPLQP